jgi:AraC family transcriptional regulator of adaptative response/methylated-DNA-[protein]-cysteine methyltransferase
MKATPDEKVTDYHLIKIGIQPEKVRRWFKQNYGITFQAYQRMIRINNAFKEIQNGEAVTSSAYGSGYGSLSGFGYTFKKLTGHTPEKSKEKDLILMSRFNSPLGPMYVCSTSLGICLLEFTDRRMLETEFRDLQRKLNSKIVAGENEHIVQLKQELQEYFEGKRKTFDVKLHTPGSEFQNAVWNLLLQVPYGTTVSYMEQAIKLNAPKAVRAVASANGHNRVCIVIPCHRVIGSDGNLTGYAGGLERKRWLLEHEKRNSREGDK